MSISSQSETTLLQTVLTATQNAVLVYQGVRNLAGELTNLRLTMLNEVAAQNLGRPAWQVVGLTFDQLYPHLVNTDLCNQYLAVLVTGQIKRFEFKYVKPHQTTLSWCDVSAVRMQENCLVVSYTDITQRKAEIEMARQAHLLKQAYNESINGIIVFEAIRDAMGQIEDFRVKMINEAGLQINGYQREEIENHTLWEIYPATSINGLFDRYVQVCETGEPFNGEHYFPEFDSWRQIKIVPVQQGILVAYNDITVAKKSKEESRQQTYLLESILEGVPVGVALLQTLWNHQGGPSPITGFRISRVNSVLEHILGKTSTEMIGRSLTTVFGKASPSVLLSHCIAAAESKEPQELELPISRQERQYWYRISITAKDDQAVLTLTDITELKQAKSAHHAQVELLTAVFDSSQSSIIVFDAVRSPSGTIIDFRYRLQNEANRRRVACSDAELLGQRLLERQPKMRTNGLFDHYTRVVEENTVFQQAVLCDTVEAISWSLLTAVKEGNGFVLTIHDITAEQVAQQQLLDQTHLLQLISNHTPAGLVLWEAVYDETPQRNALDFRYRMANQMNADVTGYSAESLLGQDLFTLFPRFRGTELELALRHTLETGDAQRISLTYYTETPGNWFDAQLVRMGTDRVLMTFMDVTEAHKAQLTYKAQADLFQTIIDAQPAGLILFTPLRQPADPKGPIVDFVYTLVNETQTRTVGRSHQDLIGQRFKTIFPSPSGQALFEVMVEVARTGQPKEWLLPFFADEVKGWFQSSVIPHGDQLLFTYLDVSELKQQQQALEILNLELQRSNDNLLQFAYIASHHLQEPLRKIQSFGDLVVTRHADALEGDSRDLINRMEVAANRMSGLIKDLLRYSQLTTHRLPFKAVSLTTILTCVCEDLSHVVSETGTLIEWTELPTVVGDANQLQQLFYSLLSNAIKFRRPAVKPEIRIWSRRLKGTELPSSVVGTALANPTTETGASQDFYEINLSDNGIGFDVKYLERIFQVFQQLHGKNEFSGTGVGLAICRKVAENHRGVLTATSQLGVGSTFTLYIPTQENHSG